MKEYMVEFDTFEMTGCNYYETNNYGQLIKWVKADLQKMGGGHADIYDEDGDFVDDVEV